MSQKDTEAPTLVKHNCRFVAKNLYIKDKLKINYFLFVNIVHLYSGSCVTMTNQSNDMASKLEKIKYGGSKRILFKTRG